MTHSALFRVIYGLLTMCILAGCTSTEAIYKNYNALGHFDHGVSAEQAKIIAQRMLINTEERDTFRISYPDVKNGPMVYRYPDYWFVVFGHNWLEPMSSDPMAGTYKELREMVYLVVINKKTGRIPFYGEWYPKRENDFDWVFDQHAYNRKDPLTLPPYKKSIALF